MMTVPTEYLIAQKRVRISGRDYSPGELFAIEEGEVGGMVGQGLAARIAPELVEILLKSKEEPAPEPSPEPEPVTIPQYAGDIVEGLESGKLNPARVLEAEMNRSTQRKSVMDALDRVR